MTDRKEAPLPVLAVVPVYNHAGTLRGVVEGLLGQGLDVLVVDDGSTDGALERVRDLPVRTFRLEPNQGKGAALLAGARIALEAGFQAVITVDADGQHHPEDARSLLERAQGHWPAIVIGHRDMGGPEVPASSRFGRSFSNFWVRLECGRTLGDTQSGYRVYPAAFLAGTRFLTRRYTFEIEVLVRGAWAGLPILEAPIGVTYQPGRQRISHFRAFRDNARLSLLHTYLVVRSLLPGGRSSLSGEASTLLAEARSCLLHPWAFMKRLALEHASPLELATAAWMGVFIGSLPIIPFGLVTILYVNHRLHLNKLAGVGASNLCVAPFVPFLCIQAGHWMLHGRFWHEFTRQTLLAEFHVRLWEWLLGALVVGPLLGLATALPTFLVLRALQRRKRDPGRP